MSGLKGNQKRGSSGKFEANPVVNPTRTLSSMTPSGDFARINGNWWQVEIAEPNQSEELSNREITAYMQSGDAEEYAGLFYSENPEDFEGLCEEVNGNFAEWAHSQGHADVLLSDWVATPGGDAPEGFPHTVAIIGGYVYDFTYKQINVDADVPEVWLRRDWEATWTPAAKPRSPQDWM